jgi:energy-coupling factor transport system ATP-binding protein
MAMQPEILILDEPTAGLDPKGRAEILREICAYREKTGSTILLVSHSMEDVANYAERILVMNAGKVFCYDTVEAVFRRASDLRKIGLSVPQITRVFGMLQENGVPVEDSVFTVEQAKEQILALYRRRKAEMEC